MNPINSTNPYTKIWKVIKVSWDQGFKREFTDDRLCYEKNGRAFIIISLSKDKPAA